MLPAHIRAQIESGRGVTQPVSYFQKIIYAHVKIKLISAVYYDQYWLLLLNFIVVVVVVVVMIVSLYIHYFCLEFRSIFSAICCCLFMHRTGARALLCVDTGSEDGV